MIIKITTIRRAIHHEDLFECNEFAFYHNECRRGKAKGYFLKEPAATKKVESGNFTKVEVQNPKGRNFKMMVQFEVVDKFDANEDLFNFQSNPWPDFKI